MKIQQCKLEKRKTLPFSLPENTYVIGTHALRVVSDTHQLPWHESLGKTRLHIIGASPAEQSQLLQTFVQLPDFSVKTYDRLFTLEELLTRQDSHLNRMAIGNRDGELYFFYTEEAYQNAANLAITATSSLRSKIYNNTSFQPQDLMIKIIFKVALFESTGSKVSFDYSQFMEKLQRLWKQRRNTDLPFIQEEHYKLAMENLKQHSTEASECFTRHLDPFISHTNKS